MLIGIAAGLLSGAFGAGGGIVIVPLLVSVAGFDQRRASATSLLAIIPTTITGSTIYFANGEVDLLAGAIIAAAAIVGSLWGTAILKRISLTWLRWLFIALLILVAIRMAFIEPVRGEPLAYSLPVLIGYLLIGLIMGLSSGLFGIGGGVIGVPALVGIMGISDLIAKGTSLLVMVPTSISGSIANVRNALVDWRAGVIIGVSAAAGSFGGALVAFALTARLSSILFAALLAVLAVQLIVRTVRGR